MPKDIGYTNSNYSALASSTIDIIKSEGKVENLYGRMKYEDELSKQRQRRMDNILNTVSKGLSLGHSVAKNISESEELINIAKDEGIIKEDNFSFFDKIFGDLSFKSSTGEVFDRKALYRRKFLKDIGR